MVNTLLTILLFFSAVGIVALVLVQRGKGADAGAGFGAGASGTVFGARGATTALSRATAILAVIFMVTCLLLTYTGSRQATAPKSVLDSVGTEPAKPAAATGAPVTAPETPPATPAPAGK